MKKLSLILILLTSIILLSGCGIYNLNCFTLPDDIEFLALIQELNTPKKICQYMADNFTYEAHAFYAPSPYTLWKTGRGDCNDFATFGIFIANYHDYETYLAKIYYKNTNYQHILAVYKENGYYTFSDNQYYNPYGQSYILFSDIIQIYNGWLSYIIYDYDMNIVKQYTK